MRIIPRTSPSPSPSSHACGGFRLRPATINFLLRLPASNWGGTGTLDHLQIITWARHVFMSWCSGRAPMPARITLWYHVCPAQKYICILCRSESLGFIIHQMLNAGIQWRLHLTFSANGWTSQLNWLTYLRYFKMDQDTASSPSLPQYACYLQKIPNLKMLPYPLQAVSLWWIVGKSTKLRFRSFKRRCAFSLNCLFLEISSIRTSWADQVRAGRAQSVPLTPYNYFKRVQGSRRASSTSLPPLLLPYNLLKMLPRAMSLW